MEIETIKQRSWTRDYLERKPGLTEFQIKLLKDGPKQLTDAWALGAMRKDWENHFQILGDDSY